MARTRTVTIRNKAGIHARAATEIVHCAQHSKSEIQLSVNGRCVPADSILQLLAAGLSCGKVVVVKADGDDADAALEKIAYVLGRAENGDAFRRTIRSVRRIVHHGLAESVLDAPFSSSNRSLTRGEAGVLTTSATRYPAFAIACSISAFVTRTGS